MRGSAAAEAAVTAETPPGESEMNDDVAAHDAAWEHFSDYVNVDYDCINRTRTALSTSASSALINSPIHYVEKL